jgi:hypothetical protein
MLKQPLAVTAAERENVRIVATTCGRLRGVRDSTMAVTGCVTFSLRRLRLPGLLEV